MTESRSSSREVRIRVPYFFSVALPFHLRIPQSADAGQACRSQIRNLLFLLKSQRLRQAMLWQHLPGVQSSATFWRFGSVLAACLLLEFLLISVVLFFSVLNDVGFGMFGVLAGASASQQYCAFRSRASPAFPAFRAPPPWPVFGDIWPGMQSGCILCILCILSVWSHHRWRRRIA